MGKNVVTLKVDSECVGLEWWKNALKAANKPELLRPILVANRTEIEVPSASVRTIEKWCESLPGWYDGPEYAPTPLRFLEG
jgi:hypothetical protein